MRYPATSVVSGNARRWRIAVHGSTHGHSDSMMSGRYSASSSRTIRRAQDEAVVGAAAHRLRADLGEDVAAVDGHAIDGPGHDLEQTVRRVREDVIALLAQIGADPAARRRANSSASDRRSAAGGRRRRTADASRRRTVAARLVTQAALDRSSEEFTPHVRRRSAGLLGSHQFLQLAALVHLHHDVRSADEFALHVELRDRRPVAE